MHKQLLKYWDKNNIKIKQALKEVKKENIDYEFLLELSLKLIIDCDDHNMPDYSKIKEIDNGGYRGTLIFIIPNKTFQPEVSDTWFTQVHYGSCSGCDTLIGILEESPCEDHIDELWTLCLHMIQRMKKMEG